MILTERLRLSNWELSDLPDLAQMNLNEEVMRYFPSTYGPEVSEEFLKNNRAYMEEKGFGWYKTALRDSGQFLGFVGIKEVRFEAHFTPAIEIGWRMVPEAWGHGYATEGARACLHQAFTELKAPEVVSFTPTTNTPSEAVMKRLGMVQDGTFMHPWLEEGHPLQEHLLYRISREQWEDSQAAR